MGPNPFLLAADDAPALRSLLQQDPSIASRQDEHGYSLLHAAASYNHVSLLRSLIGDSGVDINLRDEDGETCLFVTESVVVATCLVEELQIDTSITNDDGLTAMEKIEEEGDFLDVASYLRSICGKVGQGRTLGADDLSLSTSHTRPPPLPANVTIQVNTTSSNDLTSEPDPEFKKRIEDLASKEDFHSEQRQSELRALITDAVRGVTADEKSSRVRTQ